MSAGMINYDSLFTLGSNSIVNRLVRARLGGGNGCSPFDSATVSGLKEAIRVLISRGAIGMQKEYLRYAGKDEVGRRIVVDTNAGLLFRGLWKGEKIEADYRKINIVWRRRMSRVLRVLNSPEARPLFIWVGCGYDKNKYLNQYYPARINRGVGYDFYLAKEAIAHLRRIFPAQSSLLYIEYDPLLPLPELRYTDSSLVTCSHGHAFPKEVQDIEQFYIDLLQEFDAVFSDVIVPSADREVRRQEIRATERGQRIIRAKTNAWSDYLEINTRENTVHREGEPTEEYIIKQYLPDKYLEIVLKEHPVVNLCFHLQPGKTIWVRTFQALQQLFPEDAGEVTLQVAVKRGTDLPEKEHVTVTSLWVGDKLPEWAQMCIKSWLAHGHTYKLYTYGACAGVPQGVTICNASTVLPKDAIFPQYRYRNFSHWWRWAWLAKKGGLWVDTDVACMSGTIPLRTKVPIVPWGWWEDCLLYFPENHMVAIIMAHIGEDPMSLVPWDSEVMVTRKQRELKWLNTDAAARRAAAPYGYAKLHHHLGGLLKLPYEVAHWVPEESCGKYWQHPEQWYVSGHAEEEDLGFAIKLHAVWAEEKKLLGAAPSDSIYGKLSEKYQ